MRANAETPLDATTARQFGAEGIGLCRTEHMFFDPERIAAVREMILADDEAGRRGGAGEVLPMQRADFVELFKIMEGLPVTIRLLDPPLHEFLPHTEEDMAGGRRGHRPGRRRSCCAARRSCTRSTRCSATAAAAWASPIRKSTRCRCAPSSRPPARWPPRARPAPIPEIMVPLVAKGEEMKFLRELTDRTAKEVMAEKGREIEYQVGTMIELPRAAIRAGDIAEHAEFFSFGTNDLTQTTFGISRDDAGRFLPPTSTRASSRRIRSSGSTRRASAT